MQNFGKIKNAFNGILVESFVGDKESNKNIFKTYIKTIRENKALKTQFLVYNNIENKIEENEFKANLFLQENIALLSKFSKKEILEGNENLANQILFREETKDGYPNEELHENISKLIFTNKTSKNIDAIVEATSNIITYMKNNKLRLVNEAIELPNSMLSTIMVEKYNERYSVLDENEKEILKVLIESTDNQKQEVYKKTLKECIDLVNENLKEADLDAKDKLLQVKEKLLNDTIEVNENFFKNISKLVELKSSLKNND